MVNGVLYPTPGGQGLAAIAKSDMDRGERRSPALEPRVGADRVGNLQRGRGGRRQHPTVLSVLVRANTMSQQLTFNLISSAGPASTVANSNPVHFAPR